MKSEKLSINALQSEVRSAVDENVLVLSFTSHFYTSQQVSPTESKKITVAATVERTEGYERILETSFLFSLSSRGLTYIVCCSS